jgi:hypothetical protein
MKGQDRRPPGHHRLHQPLLLGLIVLDLGIDTTPQGKQVAHMVVAISAKAMRRSTNQWERPSSAAAWKRKQRR